MSRTVSVIIPVRRGEDISRVYKSLCDSTYKDFEIIVVDEGKERSEQRNIGIGRASGKYLLILDSDQCLSPGLLDECVRTAAFYDALYIPEKIMVPGLFGRIRDWERQFYTGTPIDCVRFVKAEGCPKFDKKQSGPEDADWDLRIKGNKTITKNIFYHYENVTLMSYLKKKAYYSKSMKRFAERNPGAKVLDWRWRCFGVFFEKGKWKKFLGKPHYAAAVMALILVRGLIYVKARHHSRKL